jgi:hypothetical protein
MERTRDYILRLIRNPPQHAPDSIAHCREEMELLERSQHDAEARAEYDARNYLRTRPSTLAEMPPENRYRLYKARQLRVVAAPVAIYRSLI